MDVAIVGYGWVGKAQHKLFPDAHVYDVDRGTRAEVNACDVALICVPTNGLPDGTLDTSIVEEVVGWCQCPLIIVRSTLNPGTADRLERAYGKNIVVVPEYIGQTTSHPLLDEKARQFLIIGGRLENRRKAIEVFQQVVNAGVRIRQMSSRAAEIVKLSENRSIGFRVMEAHELYLACERDGVDFYEIREAVYGDDPRMSLYFTFAYPDNLGFQSSKCLSKDIPAWCAWAESVGIDPVLTKALVETSRQYTRKVERLVNV